VMRSGAVLPPGCFCAESDGSDGRDGIWRFGDGRKVQKNAAEVRDGGSGELVCDGALPEVPPRCFAQRVRNHLKKLGIAF